MATNKKQITSMANSDIDNLTTGHTCLLPGKSNVQCNHWGCMVTAKTPQYYPGWKKFFTDRGTTRFHIHKRDISQFDDEQLSWVPKEMKIDKAWLTPMPNGNGNTPNLNTGWIVNAEGYWPDRSIYDFDEVSFIHVEYETLRSKSQAEIETISSTHDVDKSNFYTLLNEKVFDVKEVAIFVGVAEVKGGGNG